MIDPFWGTVASGVLGIAGDFLGGSSGPSDGGLGAQMAMQREFAKKGIRWRVKDAQKAGIHPLAALGANVSMPAAIGVNTDAGRRPNLAGSLAAAGQDITRALAARKSPHELRMERLRERELQSQIDLNQAEIDYRNSVARQRLQPGHPPPTETVEPVGRVQAVPGRLPGGHGLPWDISSGMSAEDFENEYGEAGGLIYGAGKLVGDGLRTVRNPIRRWYRTHPAGRRLHSYTRTKRRIKGYSDHVYGEKQPRKWKSRKYHSDRTRY